MSAINSPISKTNPQNALQQTIPQTPTTPNNPTGIIKQLVKSFSEFNISVDSSEPTNDLTSESFDVKQFTAAVTKTSQLSEYLSSLSHSLSSLDKEIREQVSTHHEQLLHQAINIETLDELLDMIQTRIGSLKSTSERLRARIGTPYAELNLRILQLSRLQAACDTLRRIKGILFYAAKLRAHMQAGVKDIVKSAQALNELDFLLKNFDDAAEISVIEEDVHFAHKARREVEEQAQIILEKGMQHQDQTKIGTALQVFYSLGILNQKLLECLKASERSFRKTCQDLLDTTNLTLLSTSSSSAALHTSASSSAFLTSSGTSGGGAGGATQYPGRSTMPGLGMTGQFRAQLWSNVEKLMDAMYDACSQTLQLQIILEKKKDLVSNLLYLDEIDFASIFTNKMYLANLSSSTKSNSSTTENADNSSISVYESICAVLQSSQDMTNKKSIEFLYEQWRAFANALNASILGACTQSNYIMQAFQNEYPKLLKLSNDLWLRLIQLSPQIDRYRYQATAQTGSSNIKSSDSKATISSSQNANSSSSASNFVSAYDLLRKCFQDLENSYLNRSLAHLFDPINLIFSQGIDKPINKNDVDTFVKGIQTQLQTLQYDILNNSATTNALLNNLKSASNANLAATTTTTNNATLTTTTVTSSTLFSDKVVASICKSIQMYSNKCEQLLNTMNSDLQQSLTTSTSSATSTTGSTHSGISSSNIFYYSSGQPYQIQMRTLEFVNQTHELYEQLTRLFAGNENLNRRQEERLAAALKSLVVFEENSLGLYVHSAADCILAIILSIHQEDFSNPNSNSLYMRELNQVMQRIVQNYLQQYACKPILNQYLIQLSTRCVDLFVRHASLLRPIGDSHRHRLINDSQQLENIVQNALATRLTDLGAHYKHLKAFRALLKIPPSELIDPASNSLNNVLESESIPYNLALHYLFAFGPSELKSPPQSLDWPLVKYSEWLDKHVSEKERLMPIKTCLETYVSVVRQKKEKKFAPVYPIMFRLLEKGLQSLMSSSSSSSLGGGSNQQQS